MGSMRWEHARVGLAKIIFIRCTCGIFGLEKPNIRSILMFMYSSGQPYARGMKRVLQQTATCVCFES